MGYNCCFFLNFVPLHIESPYNFGGTGPMLGVKNPLQRVNGHAGRVPIIAILLAIIGPRSVQYKKCTFNQESVNIGFKIRQLTNICKIFVGLSD
jgi:hypothetical protein